MHKENFVKSGDLVHAADDLVSFDVQEQRASELLATGQKLYARVRPSSKYYGQGGAAQKGAMFPVVLTSMAPGYPVTGGPGGRYRLEDVDLFAEFMAGQAPVQLTSELPIVK